MMLQRVSRWIPLVRYWIKIGGIQFDLQCNNYNERWNAKAHVSCVGVCFKLSKNSHCFVASHVIHRNLRF